MTKLEYWTGVRVSPPETGRLKTYLCPGDASRKDIPHTGDKTLILFY
jgi:hypothetical protein